jgi:HEAT repeat protein
MSLIAILLMSAAATDPLVARTVTEIATSTGELRASAVTRFALGCKGKHRFLWRNRNDALEPLRPVFLDEDARVRLAGLGLLGCFPQGTFEAELMTLLQDKNAEVRERAFEEAAHVASPALAHTLMKHTEDCAAGMDDLTEQAAHWCVFSLYALGRQAATDKNLPARIAELSASFAASKNARLREHAMHNLEAFGTAAHAEALVPLSRGEGRAGGQPVTDDEQKHAAKLIRKLKKRRP